MRRTVAYAWHPWAGRSVRVHGAIEKPTGTKARCGLVGVGAVRMREIPARLLDAATCHPMRGAPEPVVVFRAPDGIRSLPTEVVAYAVVGRARLDITRDALGADARGLRWKWIASTDIVTAASWDRKAMSRSPAPIG